jgi:N-acetyl-gamma-glutamylphosphate reductase
MTKTALILGSTGQTGRHLLRELITCPTYTRVCEAGRRVTPAEDLAALQGREKLEQKVVDFERLDEAGLKEGQWDVVFITYVSILSFPFLFFSSDSSAPSLSRVDKGGTHRSLCRLLL